MSSERKPSQPQTVVTVSAASVNVAGAGVDPQAALAAALQNGKAPFYCGCGREVARFNSQQMLYVVKRGRAGRDRMPENVSVHPGARVQCPNPRCRKWVILPPPRPLSGSSL